ncbi:response regulator transcription factor [Rhodothermus sp. AH-315-K08]|nr:response regulator transcription factor [Rhodothermus sp. AH-315-K08]
MPLRENVTRCLVVDDDEVARALIEHFIEETPDAELAGSFDSAIAAMRDASRSKADVIFLDVEMPGMNGLEMIEALEDAPLVVLVTANSDHAVEAFDVDVVDFLLKPVTYSRFLKSVTRVRNILETAFEVGSEDHVFVKSDGRLMKVTLAEIEWIEAQRDYVLIHTAEKDYFIHTTMKRLIDRLSGEEFVRVHRSYLVQISKIADIQNDSLVIGRKVIPIGASYRGEFLSRIRLL